MINLNATLIVQLVNFLLLMFLLDRLLFRPMARVLDERRQRTEGRRQRAAQVSAEAESIWAEYQQRIQEAKAEADAARTRLIRDGEAERQKILDAAAEQADKTVAEIRARVRAEAEEARRALRAEAQVIAGQMAQRILGRSV